MRYAGHAPLDLGGGGAWYVGRYEVRVTRNTPGHDRD